MNFFVIFVFFRDKMGVNEIGELPKFRTKQNQRIRKQKKIELGFCKGIVGKHSKLFYFFTKFCKKFRVCRGLSDKTMFYITNTIFLKKIDGTFLCHYLISRKYCTNIQNFVFPKHQSSLFFRRKLFLGSCQFPQNILFFNWNLLKASVFHRGI